MKKLITNLYDLCELYLFYFLESLCFINLHDYKYLRQKIKGYDSFGKEHLVTMDVRICNRCQKRQALIGHYWGDRYETISKEKHENY